MQKRLCLYYLKPKPTFRWFKGDENIRKFIRYLFKGRDRISSLEMVFISLCKGLKLLNIDFTINLPFDQLQANDVPVVLGQGKDVLHNYNKNNPIIAGISLMTHPNQWPTLFKDYPVKTYLQHSAWTASIYNKWFGMGSTMQWQAGIDTKDWVPINQPKKKILIYEKYLWNKFENQASLTEPIIAQLKKKNINYSIIRYGFYKKRDFKKLLAESIAMLFLCEHESQGLAYQEAMAMNIPILAWEQGLWLDPNRFEWGENDPIPASSVPYFDERCGMKFKDLESFTQIFPTFFQKAKDEIFNPRAYVLENLTVEKSAKRMLEIINQVIK